MCLNKHNFNDRYKNISFINIYIFLLLFLLHAKVAKILRCKKGHAEVRLVLRVHEEYDKYNIYINVGPGKG